MRFKVGAIALAAALLCAPLAALAEGEAISRVDALESRLLALEDKLHANEATIDAQPRRISTGAGLPVVDQDLLHRQSARGLEQFDLLGRIVG